MFTQIFSKIGGVVSREFFGNGILSTICRFTGQFLSNYLDKINYEIEEFYNVKNAKNTFSINPAILGDPIPLVFGNARVCGRVIWVNKIKENCNHTIINKFFSGNNAIKAIYNNEEYSYSLSFALAICEGEIQEIGRVWAQMTI